MNNNNVLLNVPLNVPLVELDELCFCAFRQVFEAYAPVLLKAARSLRDASMFPLDFHQWPPEEGESHGKTMEKPWKKPEKPEISRSLGTKNAPRTLKALRSFVVS
jgi:hypothetical protein